MDMDLIPKALTALIAFQHLYILYLEMFAWTQPLGLRTFKMKPEQAKATEVLAKNQGLYNGFLAVGLLFSLLEKDPVTAIKIRYLFLSFVASAGIYGGITVRSRLFKVQGIPAILGLISTYLVVN